MKRSHSTHDIANQVSNPCLIACMAIPFLKEICLCKSVFIKQDCTLKMVQLIYYVYHNIIVLYFLHTDSNCLPFAMEATHCKKEPY